MAGAITRALARLILVFFWIFEEDNMSLNLLMWLWASFSFLEIASALILCGSKIAPSSLSPSPVSVVRPITKPRVFVIFYITNSSAKAKYLKVWLCRLVPYKSHDRG
eukprot:snap_masked-scaffold_5-processed-gene-6.9-mRNA-1 protein AED:1.00 eAED:1.00 QI:0/0/0/0/1/1/4/0/106